MKAPPGLIVKAVMGQPKIDKLEICNARGGALTETPSYGQSIVLKVHTHNMIGEILKLSFWEKDTMVRPNFDPFYHEPEGNTLLWSSNVRILENNGIAEAKIMLAPNMAMLAKKKLFDNSKHTFFLLAEAANHLLGKKEVDTKPKTSERALTPTAPKPIPTPVKPAPPSKGTSILDQLKIEIKNIMGWDIFVPDDGNKKVVVDDGKVKNCQEQYCIKKGSPKSELIREINIRLAGFGGNVPTDEFTDRTEKMVKQFQRDYMKVTETGKVCGNVLRAIDEFSVKFDISNTFWNEIKCSCTTKGKKVTSKLRDVNELNNCSGFGNHTGKGIYKTGNAEKDHKYEYPGVHRSLLFGLKVYCSPKTVKKLIDF